MAKVHRAPPTRWTTSARAAEHAAGPATDQATVVHGDGAVYQKVRFNAIAYKPEMNEIVEGKVVEILRFGAFVRFGPFDGLLHISQVMDDRIDIDEQNQRLVDLLETLNTIPNAIAQAWSRSFEVRARTHLDELLTTR